MSVKKGSYCVIGMGRFGSEVAFQLHKMGKNVIILDNDREAVQRASKIYDLAVECDATDINSLTESGIHNVTTVIVAVSQVEASIMICANLRELGQKDIIAKAANNVHKRVLRTMGISRVIIPDIEMADRIAFQALFSVGVDVMGIGGGYS
jgi:trk system potassium uptake protein TrkA